MSNNSPEASDANHALKRTLVFDYERDTPEFRAELARMSRTPTRYIDVGFCRTPGLPLEGETNARAGLASRWLLPFPGDIADNFRTAASQKVIQLAVGAHGFGCADIGGRSYFTGLAAALGTPFFTFDWAGFNCSSRDAQLFRKNSWMTQIDHNPYLYLQVLEHMLDIVEPHVRNISSRQPLHLNIMGHSVGARSLLVAASVDEGRALKKIEQLWQSRLNRPVKFLLSALEPAFAMPRDRQIEALRFVDFARLHPYMIRMPHALLIALQLYLRGQADAYRLANSDLYRFEEILQPEHFPYLVAHPAAIRKPPKTPILSLAQLRELGYSVALTLSEHDKLVDNEKTRQIMGVTSGENQHSGVHCLSSEYEISVVGGHMVVNQYRTDPNATGIAYLLGKGHTVEISDPALVAAVLRLVHGLAMKENGN